MSDKLSEYYCEYCHEQYVEEFDGEYIATAENIHKNNDRRNSIKNNLNEVYKSNILELKIYKEK